MMTLHDLRLFGDDEAAETSCETWEPRPGLLVHVAGEGGHRVFEVLEVTDDGPPWGVSVWLGCYAAEIAAADTCSDVEVPR